MVVHFAWFGSVGPTDWANPIFETYDWRKPDYYQDMARLCEHAKFDMVFFGDAFDIPSAYGGIDWNVEHGFRFFHDPVPHLAMMACATKKIGLVATCSTVAYPPFLLARMLGTMDHLTSGRMGWNVVTAATADAPRNFGHDGMIEHDLRYEMADDFITICKKLWASWEPDALIEDRKAGIFADPSKVKAINHVGEFYKVAGPLTVVPSPQGKPLIVVAGVSPRGRRFALEHGDAAISHARTVESMKAYVRDMREGLAKIGRDPKSLKIFFAIRPVMGETEEIAKEKRRLRQEKANVEQGLSYLSGNLAADMRQFDLDKPIPADFEKAGGSSKLDAIRSMGPDFTLRMAAQKEALQETYEMCGSYEQIADHIKWLAEETGADGFHFRQVIQNYDYLTEIVTHLVPILKAKGIMQTDYYGETLRDRLFGAAA